MSNIEEAWRPGAADLGGSLGGSPGPRGGLESRKSLFFEYSFGSPSGRNFISKFVFIFESFFVRLDNADNADVPKTRVLSDS